MAVDAPLKATALGTLPGPEVHLWAVDPDTVADAALLARYHALMTPGEQQQQTRFYFARDRHRYLLTRALVRSVLTYYTGVPQTAWRFETNPHGRPAIAEPRAFRRLRFNLSHTPGLLVCAATLGREVGVDVEDTERPGETVAIAHRYFSPLEIRDLHTGSLDERRVRFFQYWTLKEAYIKARGLGLSIPLEQFSFHLRDGDAIRISFDPRLSDRPDRWQFQLWRPNGRHQVALAVERTGDADLPIRIRRTVPLAGPNVEERW